LIDSLIDCRLLLMLTVSAACRCSSPAADHTKLRHQSARVQRQR